MVFREVLAQTGWGEGINHAVLVAVLVFEAGLLLVAANTGFLGGPAVLASMATDRWLPRQFRQLSSRLVTQNGVLLMGGAALAALLLTRGAVAVLVVLYSINVFLTFTLTLFGLCRHWYEQRLYVLDWRGRFALSVLGLVVTSAILVVIVVEKFTLGGWATLVLTGAVILLCLVIHRHYEEVRELVRRIDRAYDVRQAWNGDARPPLPGPSAPTAVFLPGESRGAGWMALHWVLERFPGAFANFVFVSVGEVDRDSFNSERTLRSLQARLHNSLAYFTSYCASGGLPARAYEAYGSDPLAELSDLADRIVAEYLRCMFFASKLMFDDETLWTLMLHNQLPLAVQSWLMLRGQQVVIIPLRVPDAREVIPGPART